PIAFVCHRLSITWPCLLSLHDALPISERAGSNGAAAADGAVLTEAQAASVGVRVDDLLLPRDGEPVGALVAGGVLGELVAGHGAADGDGLGGDLDDLVDEGVGDQRLAQEVA